MQKREEVSARIQTERQEAYITRVHGLPRFNQISPNQAQQTTNQQETPGKGCRIHIFYFLFLLHLLLTFALIIFCTTRGLIADHKFRPALWYPPLLASAACALALASACLLLTLAIPSKILIIVFWLSPILAICTALIFVSIGTGGGLALGALALIFALILSLYTCWVNPRRPYASRILLASLLNTPVKAGKDVALALLADLIYSCFWLSGVGGAMAAGSKMAGLYVLVLLLSLAWTMHVLRNIVHVQVARVAYLHFTRSEAPVDARAAPLGSICLGSALVPIVGMVRGLARAMNLVAGDTDEFLFSCASCCMGLADGLVRYVNRWAFVQVGAHGKGFVESSVGTWEAFTRQGMLPLIDTDLTASLCLMCGVATAGICALVAGTWAIVAHAPFKTEITIFAFLHGYFTSRIAMAWPQACVAAYYVAFAENPQNQQLDSAIHDRIRQLQTSQL